MKIVIIGFGNIGETILIHLLKEGHEITVIEQSREVAKHAADKYDISCVVGNGAVIDVQRQAEVPHSDLVIACTGSDELNILACTVAKRFGVRTVLKSDGETFYHQVHMMRDDYGIKMTVNPEYEAATEVAHILRFPTSLQVEIFSDVDMELVDYVVENDNPLLGTKISEKHGRNYGDVQICAVQRGDEVIIPHGDFMIRAGDRISIIAKPETIVDYFKDLGIIRIKVRNIMILGGGERSVHLAQILEGFKIKSKIIDKDHNRCLELAEELPKSEIIYGEGYDYELLLDEGLDEMDALVAFTDSNEKNIILSLYAKTKNVKKVITAIDDDALLSIASELELGSIISPNILTATRILRFVRGLKETGGSKIDVLYKICSNKAELAEFIITEGFKYENVPLKNLKLIDNTIVAIITRGGKAIIPRGHDVIMRDDKVVIVTTEQNAEGINDFFTTAD